MDDALHTRVEELRDEVIAASEQLSAALEAGEDQMQLAAERTVVEVAKKWNRLFDDAPVADRDQLERTVGRRVLDLRRAAEGLTRKQRSGAQAVRSADAGIVPFLEQRIPGKSIVPSRLAPTRDMKQFRVGAEVEAWCGKCRELRTHSIVAMVGELPKQVICGTCRSRHGYRTAPTPGRAAAAAAAGANGTAASGGASSGGTVKRTLNAADREAQRKLEMKQALWKELDAATEPRKFDPKGRYKAGEIIVHAEHGRGKIENVLKGSLLVRFREGLRPLNLS